MSNNMEIQTIGLEVDLSDGIYNKTRYHEGKLQLAVKTLTYDDNQYVYYQNGSWESRVIDTVDKYLSLSNLAIGSQLSPNVMYKAYTRTSEDGVSWEEYREITLEGNITSTMNRYIQVKIELFGGLTSYTDILENFNSSSRVKYNNTNYVDFIGCLALKKNFTLNPIISSHGDGRLYVTRVERTKLKRVDRLKINV